MIPIAEILRTPPGHCGPKFRSFYSVMTEELHTTLKDAGLLTAGSTRLEDEYVHDPIFESVSHITFMAAIPHSKGETKLALVRSWRGLDLEISPYVL